MKLSELDGLENSLIQQYKTDIEKTVRKMTDKQFKAMLLQRRWSSNYFTLLYDFGIDGIDNERAKHILREIRNEEYPSGRPSHREDLVHDLEIIGITREEIINSEISKSTSRVVQDQIDMLKIMENRNLHDIKGVTFLRFALEILVSAEYGIFIDRLKDFGLTRKNSKFYWPHYLHDMKQSQLGKNGVTHSDEIAGVLAEMLDTEKKIKFCGDVAAKSYKLRMAFFDQFK